MSKQANWICCQKALQLSKLKCSKWEDVQPTNASPWSFFISNSVNHSSEESWCNWVGLPKHSFDELVNSCKEIWRLEPLNDYDGTPHTYDLKRHCLDCQGTVALLLTFINK
jgi:hypothetical protein